MTKTIPTIAVTIDLLPPERLAYELATLLDGLPANGDNADARSHRVPFSSVLDSLSADGDNVGRHQLRNVAALLTAEPPKLAEALATARRGVAHAIRPDYTEERPETYLLVAVVQALSRANDARAAAADVPTAWAFDSVADRAVTDLSNDLFDTEAMLRATESHFSDIELRADLNDGDATNLRRLLQMSAERVARVAKELGGVGWLSRVQPAAAAPGGPVWLATSSPLAPAAEGAPVA